MMPRFMGPYPQFSGPRLSPKAQGSFGPNNGAHLLFGAPVRQFLWEEVYAN